MIVAEGLQEIYFEDGGTRADRLRVEFTDIDCFDVSFRIPPPVAAHPRSKSRHRHRHRRLRPSRSPARRRLHLH
ncbi:hypothetical protein [Streptomyces sp. NPDC092307]|uniref:hypothetical protein n=1 Tax=Streptomyces sp. NPDC092307 TaxID=3366013 RepID=UPI003816A9A0